MRREPDGPAGSLTSIHGYWLLHDEYAELDDEDWDDSEEESADKTAERRQHHSLAQFAVLVRTVAAKNRDRLV